MNTAAPHRFPGPLWPLRKRVTVVGAILEAAVRIFITMSPVPQTRTQSLFCIRAVIDGRDLVRTRASREEVTPKLVPRVFSFSAALLENEKTLGTTLPPSKVPLRFNFSFHILLHKNKQV